MSHLRFINFLEVIILFIFYFLTTKPAKVVESVADEFAIGEAVTSGPGTEGGAGRERDAEPPAV